MSNGTKQTDVRVEDRGADVLVRPLTRTGREWIDANVVAEAWQWVDGALGFQRRSAEWLVESLTESGLCLEVRHDSRQ